MTSSASDKSQFYGKIIEELWRNYPHEYWNIKIPDVWSMGEKLKGDLVTESSLFVGTPQASDDDDQERSGSPEPDLLLESEHLLESPISYSNRQSRFWVAKRIAELEARRATVECGKHDENSLVDTAATCGAGPACALIQKIDEDVGDVARRNAIVASILLMPQDHLETELVSLEISVDMQKLDPAIPDPVAFEKLSRLSTRFDVALPVAMLRLKYHTLAPA